MNGREAQKKGGICGGIVIWGIFCRWYNWGWMKNVSTGEIIRKVVERESHYESRKRKRPGRVGGVRVPGVASNRFWEDAGPEQVGPPVGWGKKGRTKKIGKGRHDGNSCQGARYGPKMITGKEGVKQVYEPKKEITVHGRSKRLRDIKNKNGEGKEKEKG